MFINSYKIISHRGIVGLRSGDCEAHSMTHIIFLLIKPCNYNRVYNVQIVIWLTEGAQVWVDPHSWNGRRFSSSVTMWYCFTDRFSSLLYQCYLILYIKLNAFIKWELLYFKSITCTKRIEQNYTFYKTEACCLGNIIHIMVPSRMFVHVLCSLPIWINQFCGTPAIVPAALKWRRCTLIIPRLLYVYVSLWKIKMHTFILYWGSMCANWWLLSWGQCSYTCRKFIKLRIKLYSRTE